MPWVALPTGGYVWQSAGQAAASAQAAQSPAGQANASALGAINTQFTNFQNSFQGAVGAVNQVIGAQFALANQYFGTGGRLPTFGPNPFFGIGQSLGGGTQPVKLGPVFNLIGPDGVNNVA